VRKFYQELEKMTSSPDCMSLCDAQSLCVVVTMCVCMYETVEYTVTSGKMLIMI